MKTSASAIHSELKDNNKNRRQLHSERDSILTKEGSLKLTVPHSFYLCILVVYAAAELETVTHGVLEGPHHPHYIKCAKPLSGLSSE